MSLDGYISDASGGVRDLFGWYNNGPVTVPMPNGTGAFQVSAASAGYLRRDFAEVKAIVSGRRTFDATHGFAGGHPYGVPVFVVTHTMPPGWPRADSPVTIVTDGLASAVAQASEVAGDGTVSVGAASVARQCLELRLLDVVRINLVPVLLGDGLKLIDGLANAPVTLADPEVVQGEGVTHLSYRVTYA
jgi:dihydrofolate reductase